VFIELVVCYSLHIASCDTKVKRSPLSVTVVKGALSETEASKSVIYGYCGQAQWPFCSPPYTNWDNVSCAPSLLAGCHKHGKEGCWLAAKMVIHFSLVPLHTLCSSTPPIQHQITMSNTTLSYTIPSNRYYMYRNKSTPTTICRNLPVFIMTVERYTTEQDRQCMYNVTLRCTHATAVAVDKQFYIF
jgi:hypothetical protein